MNGENPIYTQRRFLDCRYTSIKEHFSYGGRFVLALAWLKQQVALRMQVALGSVLPHRDTQPLTLLQLQRQPPLLSTPRLTGLVGLSSHFWPAGLRQTLVRIYPSTTPNCFGSTYWLSRSSGISDLIWRCFLSAGSTDTPGGVSAPVSSASACDCASSSMMALHFSSTSCCISATASGWTV